MGAIQDRTEPGCSRWPVHRVFNLDSGRALHSQIFDARTMRFIWFSRHWHHTVSAFPTWRWSIAIVRWLSVSYIIHGNASLAVLSGRGT